MMDPRTKREIAEEAGDEFDEQDDSEHNDWDDEDGNQNETLQGMD